MRKFEVARFLLVETATVSTQNLAFEPVLGTPNSIKKIWRSARFTARTAIAIAGPEVYLLSDGPGRWSFLGVDLHYHRLRAKVAAGPARTSRNAKGGARSDSSVARSPATNAQGRSVIFRVYMIYNIYL